MNLEVNNRNVYITSDIHNDAERFQRLLEEIHFSKEDILIIAGDVFNRGDKPVELYLEILRHDNIYVVQGNHDVWFCREVMEKLAGEKVGEYLSYNTFELMLKKLTQEDMLHLADWIKAKPYHIKLTLNERVYHISHAQTYPTPDRIFNKYDLYMGNAYYYEAFLEGRNEPTGYISVVGHCPTDNHKIWISPTGRTIRIDCGNGFPGGCLGAIRLNDMQEYYIQ